jgi:hypothetical protein
VWKVCGCIQQKGENYSGDYSKDEGEKKRKQKQQLREYEVI